MARYMATLILRDGRMLDIKEIKFLYYLNPKSLDRNLEWDMKTNLCTDPGCLFRLDP